MVKTSEDICDLREQIDIRYVVTCILIYFHFLSGIVMSPVPICNAKLTVDLITMRHGVSVKARCER